MRGDRKSFGGAPGASLSDRLRQQREQLRRRSEIVAAQMAKTAARLSGTQGPANENQIGGVNADLWIQSLRNIPLRAVGASPVPLSEVYDNILRAAIGSMNNREPVVLMTWPARDICLSAVTSLLALADVAACAEIEVEAFGSRHRSYERPRGMRALIYPYARTTHEPARDIQVDRDYLYRTHLAHLTRHASGSDADGTLKDYHQTLSRVRTLDGRGRDGTVRPEYEHPTLDEILPHGNCEGTVLPH